MCLTRVCFALAVGLQLLYGQGASVLRNGGFEENLAGWRPFWAREEGAGEAALDEAVVREGRQSLRVGHRGAKDWCVNADLVLPVRPGELWSLTGWARVQGEGTVTLAVELRDGDGRALDWAYGGRTLEGTNDWVALRSRLVIPEGAATMVPRWIGNGPATVWLDAVSLVAEGTVASLRRPLPDQLSLRNPALLVTLRTGEGVFAVTDRRTGQVWEQRAVDPGLVLLSAAAGARFELVLLDIGSGLLITNRWELDAHQPELLVTLESAGEMTRPLRFPHPFVSTNGTYLVIPMNEGISFPVDDPAIEPLRLITYGGHGICMSFWGVTDGERGHLGLFETADDAAIHVGRRQGLLQVEPEWEPQRRTFGPARRLRYVFFDHGGHVAIAKRYRAYAQAAGRFKTLAQKRAENPHVDRLVGAANIWCWDRDAVALVRELQAAGLERLLWSNQQPPAAVEALNGLGVLTSRYDIFQDVMDPANFPHLGHVHPDWVTAAWPQDVIRDARGQWLRGWEVRGTNAEWYACGILCDRRAPEYARQRLPADLSTHPYRCRFIDTTTAAPWHECYAPAHPMTRTESREWKMRLLAYICDETRLVTGCETGHDAAVPWVHYFEGMLSLGPYRVPEAGRDMARLWLEVPERVAKFQLGHRYRLPLWELVYHECVVAQWYWGDYNNKLPSLWERRDLFNALYGTPPMYMFDRGLWQRERERFVRSYHTASPVARATGYAEMVDHRFLTPDRDVQQTAFANGIKVTANFGETPFTMADGVVVGALGLRVEGTEHRP